MAIKRETWAGRFDFLISTVGLSIGFGNVWRFPYLCYQHGGGAFLIPYFMFAVFCGISFVYTESLVGQLTKSSPIKCWNFCPLFSGIGIACAIGNVYSSTFYIVILCWCFHYFFSSFQHPLPWSRCDPLWATPNCRTKFSDTIDSSEFTDPVNEYFKIHVLRLTDSINNVGPPNWPLVGCLVLSYTLCFFIIFKGIKISGKVMYFTATAPFILLVVLLIRSLTLKGAMKGVKYFIFPDVSKLSTIQIWADAGAQIFFSYAISCGALISLGSHNKLSHNSFVDAFRCSICNSFCSILSGFVIFPILGFMADRQGVPIDKVAAAGPGLAFVAYPRALVELPGSTVWSIIFFICLILIGLDSQFVIMESSVLCIEDILGERFCLKYRRELITFILSGFSFLISLTMVTNGGMYIFNLFNEFYGSKVLPLLGFLEIVAVFWVYGYDRLLSELRLLDLPRPPKFCKYVFVLLAPAISMAIFVLSLVTSKEFNYNGYIYPSWAIAIGYLLLVSVIVPSIVMPCYHLLRLIILTEGPVLSKFKRLIECQNIVSGPDEPRESQPN